MNRIKGLALGVGVATLIVVGLACGAGEKQNPAGAEPVSDAPQAQDQPGPSGSPGANTSPAIPGGAPLVELTYEGAVYYMAALSTDEAANLNENDLELVGATTESNLLAPGSGKSLDIYKLNDREEGYVYTLQPGQSHVNPEDGQIFEFPAVWMRWTPADSNGT